MAQRLQWADISPFRAVLYQIDDDNPFNKKVASVEYNHNDGTFYALIFHRDRIDKPCDVDTDRPNKVAAMESAMAMLVARRFDETN